MSRAKILVSLAVLTLALSAPALAGNGYRIWGSVFHHVHNGSLFQVNSSGKAPQQALLYVYLASQPCRFTQASEANHFPAFKTGESYFRDNGRSVITLSVSGRISMDWIAHAGATLEHEYACSYLTIPNASGSKRLTMARRSASFFVVN